MIIRVRETQGNSDYDGSHDHHNEVWTDNDFLQGRYEEYNSRFFNNQLPHDISVLVWNGQSNISALGLTWTGFYDVIDHKFLKNNEIDFCDENRVEVRVPKILMRNASWASRYQLENALVHEMCHVYQIYIILKQNPQLYLAEHKKFKAHGDSFAQAAMKVNLNKDNHDNEQFFVSSGAFRDAIKEGGRFHRVLSHIHKCFERNREISSKALNTLEQYGCFVENGKVVYDAKLERSNRMLNEIFQCIETHKPLLPRQKRFLAKYNHRVDEHWNLVKIKNKRVYRD